MRTGRIGNGCIVNPTSKVSYTDLHGGETILVICQEVERILFWD